MEEEMTMAETEQEDAAGKGESSLDLSNNSPAKRGRGRPKGLKRLQVCVTDVNLMELVSGISNSGSTPSKRGRGRPKLSGTTHTIQHGSGVDLADITMKTLRDQESKKVSGSKKQDSDEEHSPKKRGRPKGSLNKSSLEKVVVANLPNGGSDTPRKESPRSSIKRNAEHFTSSEEDEGSAETPRKRGRPKGSPNKTPRRGGVSSKEQVANEANLSSPKRGRGRPRKVVEVNKAGESLQDVSNGISKRPQRGRGRPGKRFQHESEEEEEDEEEDENEEEEEEVEEEEEELLTNQPTKRGRGRPKGSLNKKPSVYTVHKKVVRSLREHLPPPRLEAVLPTKKDKRGRPRNEPAKRGRPRKYPLPSPEELKKPKVWKPLGRPRKYPRVDPPEGATTGPRRSRGRPRKTESKKGAHLRKRVPTPASSPRATNVGTPRKRGLPPSAAKDQSGTPRKRGRPKGSVNKNEARNEKRLHSKLPNRSKADYSTSVGVENEGETLEKQVKLEEEDHADDTLIEDASLEVTN